MIVIFESVVMCFILLIICIVGISGGPQGLLVFYEQEVKDRAVGLGLTTKERIQRNSLIVSAALYVPILFLVPSMVWFINGARDFEDIFRQITVILLIMGLFDRLFIDHYWVGHTKAWIIPGTEDLMPYIPKKTLIKKWIGTVIGFPLLAAAEAFVLTLGKII
ncbi:MAG: hypothetical protein NC120_11600 [Ruminococcus sp.]|nr:hypothetical protein [Ruminococcus sp.]